MTESFSHLTSGARAALASSVEERIAYMKRDRWVKYDRAEAIMCQMDGLLRHPKAARMPCLMVVGDPNNGKTHLVRKFHKRHPPIDGLDGEGMKIPVLLIEDLKGPDERGLYNSIIETLGFPNKPNNPIPKLEYKAHRLLVHYEVRVLLLDEFNTIANGAPTKQRHMLNVLKTMSTRRQMSIIGAGTRDAFQLMQLDTQFSSRFELAPLPSWRMGPAWRSLLASFEKVLPLPEPSGLSEPKFAQFLLAQSDQTIGDTWDLLERMTEYAIRAGAPRLNSNMAAAIHWTKPSERLTNAQQQTAWAEI